MSRSDRLKLSYLDRIDKKNRVKNFKYVLFFAHDRDLNPVDPMEVDDFEISPVRLGDLGTAATFSEKVRHPSDPSLSADTIKEWSLVDPAEVDCNVPDWAIERPHDLRYKEKVALIRKYMYMFDLVDGDGTAHLRSGAGSTLPWTFSKHGFEGHPDNENSLFVLRKLHSEQRIVPASKDMEDIAAIADGSFEDEQDEELEGQEEIFRMLNEELDVNDGDSQSGTCDPPPNLPSSSSKDRSDPRMPSQEVSDLYGGNEQQALTHWWNTH